MTVTKEASIAGTGAQGERPAESGREGRKAGFTGAEERFERALRESEKRYRGLFETLPDGFGSVDMQGRIIEVNPAFEAIVGYTREELRGMAYEKLTPETWRPFDRQIEEAQLSRRGYSDLYEKEYIRRDGSLVPVEIRMHLGGDEGGETPHVWVFARDITGRRLAEEALKSRERELEKRTADLEETNSALKVVLRHREEDRKILESAILDNVKKLVFPYMDKLRRGRLTDNQELCLAIIESNLNDIISPFLQRPEALYARLTPTEIRIADMIRGGRTTGEIAQVLGVCQGTVEVHRSNIRSKLGLSNKKINLRTYLLSL